MWTIDADGTGLTPVIPDHRHRWPGRPRRLVPRRLAHRLHALRAWRQLPACHERRWQRRHDPPFQLPGPTGPVPVAGLGPARHTATGVSLGDVSRDWRLEVTLPAGATTARTPANPEPLVGTARHTLQRRPPSLGDRDPHLQLMKGVGSGACAQPLPRRCDGVHRCCRWTDGRGDLTGRGDIPRDEQRQPRLRGEGRRRQSADHHGRARRDRREDADERGVLPRLRRLLGGRQQDRLLLQRERCVRDLDDEPGRQRPGAAHQARGKCHVPGLLAGRHEDRLRRDGGSRHAQRDPHRRHRHRCLGQRAHELRQLARPAAATSIRPGPPTARRSPTSMPTTPTRTATPSTRRCGS